MDAEQDMHESLFHGVIAAGIWREIRPTELGLVAIVGELNGLGKVDIVTVGFSEQKAEWLNLHGIQYDELVPVCKGKDKADLGVGNGAYAPLVSCKSTCGFPWV